MVSVQASYDLDLTVRIVCSYLQRVKYKRNLSKCEKSLTRVRCSNVENMFENLHTLNI